jgi:NAD(P)-dependent dehydrogenase (short-subunit alcohol dehydrogenase family)
VRLFAKAVAMECAAEADGIWVNTVHPGVIDTPIWTKLSGSGGRNVPIDPNKVAKAGVPLGEAGQAQNIANGALPRLRRPQLHDGCGACDRRRDDGRRETAVELTIARRPGRFFSSFACGNGAD